MARERVRVSWLIKKGELKPSVLKGTRGKRGGLRFKRPWAIRRPRGLKPKEPRDLVEVDTLSVTLSPGKVIKQFTARDVVSGWNEFYESYDLPLELGELRQVVREWECICNFLRPSRSPGGKTPGST